MLPTGFQLPALFPCHSNKTIRSGAAILYGCILWGCCLIRACTVRALCILLGIVCYQDPERMIFSHKIGFFMVVVDAGQLFSCWLTIGCPLFENFLFQIFLSFDSTVHSVG